MPQDDTTLEPDAIASDEGVRKAIEQWESEKAIPGWLRAATRALHRYPRGRELLEREFDDAIRAATELTLR